MFLTVTDHGFDCARTRKTAAPGQRERPDCGELVLHGLGVGRARGQHRDTDARGDHVAYGFERTPFKTVLRAVAGGAGGAGAGLQHLVAKTIAARQQQQVFPAQIRSRDPGFFRPCMLRRHQHAKRFIVKRAGFYTRPGIRQRQDNHVEIAVPEHFAEFRREALLDQQRHFRRAPVEQRNQLRHQIGADGVDRAKAQRAGEIVLALRREVLDHVGFFQHPLRLFDDALPNRRDCHFSRAALEQRDAEFIFEFFDRDRQCRLADETFFRGAAEMALACDGDDITQFGEGHDSRPGGVLGISFSSPPAWAAVGWRMRDSMDALHVASIDSLRYRSNRPFHTHVLLNQRL